MGADARASLFAFPDDFDTLSAEYRKLSDCLAGLLWVARRNGVPQNDPYVIRAAALLSEFVPGCDTEVL